MGKIAEETLRSIPDVFPDIRVDKYVVMPNHVHMILDVCKSGASDINVVMGQYKMTVTRKIRERKPEYPVWQRSFHDHVIRDQKRYEKVWLYIEANPMRWEEDCFYMASEKTDRFREGQ
jgi:REP element-mobilizing transposase RayT